MSGIDRVCREPVCCALHLWPNARAKRVRTWRGVVRDESPCGGSTGAPVVACLEDEDVPSACSMDEDLAESDWFQDGDPYVHREDRWDGDLAAAAEPWDG